jgi:hypothetical protein
MKYQISNISVLQTSKVLAILYAAFGLVMVPFGCLFLALGTDDPTYPIIGVTYLLGPLLYGVFGFIFSVIGTWLYNIVARWTGGIEFEVAQIPHTQPS